MDEFTERVVENFLKRKPTEEEKKEIEEDIRRSKELNTGSTEALKRYGIVWRMTENEIA